MKVKILVVEDDPITLLDLEEILTRNGFEICGKASSYSGALEHFHRQKPDVMLVDIKLAGQKDGPDFVNEVITQSGKKIPTVYLTANSDTFSKDRAFKTHPSSFLTKPFSPKDVLNALELAFNNHQSEEGLTDSENPILIKSHKEYAKIYESDIIYVEANGSYSKVVTGEKEYLLSLNLTHCLKRLNLGKFTRIHRSYVVNNSYITQMEHNHVLLSEYRLPIGRMYKDQLLNTIKRLG